MSVLRSVKFVTLLTENWIQSTLIISTTLTSIFWYLDMIFKVPNNFLLYLYGKWWFISTFRVSTFSISRHVLKSPISQFALYFQCLFRPVKIFVCCSARCEKYHAHCYDSINYCQLSVTLVTRYCLFIGFDEWLIEM